MNDKGNEEEGKTERRGPKDEAVAPKEMREAIPTSESDVDKCRISERAREGHGR